MAMKVTQKIDIVYVFWFIFNTHIMLQSFPYVRKNEKFRDAKSTRIANEECT
jgi:hypothetical protein